MIHSRTLTTALAILLLLVGGAATQKLNTPTFSPAQNTYEKFAGSVDGTKQARGHEKDLKPRPDDTQEKPCRSDEIREYLLQHGIIPPSKTPQERLLAGATPEVRVIYLVPSDRQPRSEAPIALTNGIKHLQRFYWEQLGNGKTFQLHDPIVETRISTHETIWFSTNPAGDNPSVYLWFNSINDASAQFFDPNYTYVIYVDVNAPGQAVGGAGGVALLPQNDILGMIGQNTIEPNVCRWVGGLGHELGHALGLPHPPECDSHQSPDNSFPCQSLMYLGYLIYPNTYLLSDNKAALTQNPFIVPLQLNTAAFGCSNLLIPQGPSLVSVNGRQLIVSKRNPDGTLATPAPYVIRGVDWSPASKTTNTSTGDPNNAAVRRPEFGLWAATDIPLLRNMHVNTVRTFIDPGIDAVGTAVLDQLYSNGIMVVMTVDDAINDLTRVQQAVNFYKNHPAVLAWMLGNEWNINRYYGVASSVQDAAQRTQTAAALIKSLDSTHPVMTSYGEIDFSAVGSSLADTQNYVNNVCPSIDVWGLNIYRGNTFNTLFDQWRAITAKPMLLGEFGTDAFRSAALGAPVPGIVDETLQAHWDLSEWNDLFINLSANDPVKVAVGGFVFEWNDEWWKVASAGSQQTSGFVLFNGHPDDFANEEYFGIVDIDRHPRSVYGALAAAFDPAYQPPGTVNYRAVSRGAPAAEYGGQIGVAWFFENGAKLYHATGGGGGGRGFNVAAVDTCTGALRQPVQHFDTFITRNTGAALNDMNIFLDSLPPGTLVMISVADEAGLNNFPPNDCEHLSNVFIEPFFQRLEALGSQQIRNYCYQNSYTLVAIKGEGVARSEQLGSAVEASAQTAAPTSTSISPTGQSFPKSGGTGSLQVTATAGCSWTGSASDAWITVTSGGSGSGNAVLNYSVGMNSNTGFRTGTITVAGRLFTVVQSDAATTLRIDSGVPRAGRVAGNQQINLTGSFAGLSSVTMGGTSASWSYTNGAGDPSAITVTTPAHAIGAVSIDVMPTSGSSYSRSNAFAFLPTTFTDNTIAAGVTTVKGQHIIEVRQAVDALRAVAGLAPAPWTDPTLLPASTLIKTVHITELRSNLENVAALLGYPAGSYTDPGLGSGFVIKRLHIEELRQRIRTIAG